MAQRTRVGDVKDLFPNEALSALTGSGLLSRHEVTERVWDHIERNGLQDEKNKRMINADEKLKLVFGRKTQVSMFEMTRLVSDCLFDEGAELKSENSHGIESDGFISTNVDSDQRDADVVSHLDVETVEENDAVLSAAVAASLQLSSAERQARLRDAPKQPSRKPVQSYTFARNVDVIAEVLYRANGYCEVCASAASFLRAGSGAPYLEVHHRIQLAKGGDDTVENAVACCPNCHRKQHYG